MNITISSPEWSREAIAASWADDSELSVEQVSECADTEIAWLINNMHEQMPGWSFTGGAFTGPARKEAITEILDLLTQAVDYVVEHLDEIKAEVA